MKRISTSQEQYMKRCFLLADFGKHGVKTNPTVGSVIVKNGKIIGEGYHEYYGGPHAEINAIESVIDKSQLKGAELFVTLEPCSHKGKTPPCTDAIIQSGISKVYISQKDPNPKVNGSGIKKLRESGIQVIESVLKEEGKSQLERFAINILQQRPFVILKYAISADGFVGQKDQSVWLSNEFTRSLAHKWRSESDAILVGANTVLLDDPSLNVRFGFQGDLKTIVLDKEGLIPPTSRIFQNQRKVTIVKDEIGSEQSVKSLLEDLYLQNIGSLIVEGGARTLNLFAKTGYWDECRIFRTPVSLKDGLKAPNLRGSLIKKYNLGNNEVVIFNKTQEN